VVHPVRVDAHGRVGLAPTQDEVCTRDGSDAESNCCFQISTRPGDAGGGVQPPAAVAAATRTRIRQDSGGDLARGQGTPGHGLAAGVPRGGARDGAPDRAELGRGESTPSSSTSTVICFVVFVADRTRDRDVDAVPRRLAVHHADGPVHEGRVPRFPAGGGAGDGAATVGQQAERRAEPRQDGLAGRRLQQRRIPAAGAGPGGAEHIHVGGRVPQVCALHLRLPAEVGGGEVGGRTARPRPRRFRFHLPAVAVSGAAEPAPVRPGGRAAVPVGHEEPGHGRQVPPEPGQPGGVRGKGETVVGVSCRDTNALLQEPYMEVVNPFILKNKERMVVFLDHLSNVADPGEPRITTKPDTAKELATLHHICVAHLAELQAVAKLNTNIKTLVTVTEMLATHKQKYLEMIR
jgi:hypothetical protein